MTVVNSRWVQSSFFVLLLIWLNPAGACSIKPGLSLLDRYTQAEQVFVGRIESDGMDSYFQLSVQEIFKGLDSSWLQDIVSVPFDTTTACGFEAPKPGDRFLIYMNPPAPVSILSGSARIWSEAQAMPSSLNPIEEELLTLRAMLQFGFDFHSQIAPTPEAALHLALKVWLPAYGQAVVSANRPFKITLLQGKNEKSTIDDRWFVSGLPQCEPSAPAACPPTLSAQIELWSGRLMAVNASKPGG